MAKITIGLNGFNYQLLLEEAARRKLPIAQTCLVLLEERLSPTVKMPQPKDPPDVIAKAG